MKMTLSLMLLITLVQTVCLANYTLPETNELRVELYSTVFVYPLTDPYCPLNQYGFNHAPSLVQMPDNRLLCAWFSGPFEASVNQVLLASYSDDFGMTWNRAFVLQDEPRDSDFDPAFIRDGDRVWLFYIKGRWCRWPFVKNERNRVGVSSYEINAKYTDNSGRTWSDERVIEDKAQCRSNGIKLNTSELLLPFQDLNEKNNPKCGVLRSEDAGKTWHRSKEILNLHRSGIDEPSVAQMANGNLLMVLRTRDSHLWTCNSNDKGKTWSEPKRHGMLAGSTSHNIINLSDGRILLTHNECKAGSWRSPLTCRVTKDGKQWSQPLVLASVPAPGQGNDYQTCQVTYPSAWQVNNDTVVVVWTRIKISDTEQYGEVHAARIKLKKLHKAK